MIIYQAKNYPINNQVLIYSYKSYVIIKRLLLVARQLNFNIKYIVNIN